MFVDREIKQKLWHIFLWTPCGCPFLSWSDTLLILTFGLGNKFYTCIDTNQDTEFKIVVGRTIEMIGNLNILVEFWFGMNEANSERLYLYIVNAPYSAPPGHFSI